MIEEQTPQSYASGDYCQYYTVTTILAHIHHMMDCLQTIRSDESNPYPSLLSWLWKKQPQSLEDELFLDLLDECSKMPIDSGERDSQLRPAIKVKLEKFPKELRKDIVTRTKDGCAPLFMACKLGLLNKARYLLENCGADIEQKGHYEALEDNYIHLVSPIWVAAVSGHLEIVKLLVANGANVNALSDTGSTPLRSVCFMCKDDDGFQRNLFDRPQPVDSDRQDDIYFEIVKFLVTNGADISRPNFNGGTCIINSIQNLQLTQYMLDNGAEVNARDNQSKTALHYAIQQNRLGVVILLLKRGANPFLYTNDCDDALQLACLGGHTEIFDHLIQNVAFPVDRLVDAYKLMGSSILELHYDLSRVHELWSKALDIQRSSSSNHSSQQQIDAREERLKSCDTRRLMAYGDRVEFSSESELQSLSADDYKIQSLIISERVLGTNHRETVQRLLHRGTSYINSTRPERCIDLWIYALKLRLSHESIFHIESVFYSQAITTLFLELTGQQKLKFRDVQDVLSLLIEQLDECKEHFKHRPISYLHEEFYNMLLGVIVYLLFILDYTKEPSDNHLALKSIKKIIKLSPRSSDGSSLLHICVSPNVIKGIENQFRTSPLTNCQEESPLVRIIELLVENGMDVDSTNLQGLSALQSLCLASLSVSDKRPLIKRLVRYGAHVDRRPARSGQEEAIRVCLRDSGINLMEHVKLSCLAARTVAEMKIKPADQSTLAQCLKESVSIH